jgi:hypothetical protein
LRLKRGAQSFDEDTTMTELNKSIDVEYLVQKTGMTEPLATLTIQAFETIKREERGDIKGSDQCRTVVTEAWLRMASRAQLLEAGVLPFAADRIAHFQSLVDEDEKKAANESTVKKVVDVGIVAGSAAIGVTQAAAVGGAALPLLGFTAAGVAPGSLAALAQGSAITAGSWFSLLQSAGATGMIAGPVGAAAAVTGAALFAGGGMLLVYGKNKYFGETEKAETSVDNQPSNVQVPNAAELATSIGSAALTVEFLLRGIPDLTLDDAFTLLNSFKTRHVLTVDDFLIVSRATMKDMYLDKVLLLQKQTITNEAEKKLKLKSVKG